MKRLFRYVCVLIAALTLVSMFGVMNASAANGTTIDASNAKYGFVTVNYTSSAKLKVGIQYQGGKIAYKNCPSGKDAVFSLEQGDGTYTISLCENISGTTYRIVTSKRVNAKIENAYAPHQGLRRQQLPRLEQGQRGRQQLPRLEQGQRGRQLVPDRPHLRRDQTCAERRRSRGLRLSPDLQPAERLPRRRVRQIISQRMQRPAAGLFLLFNAVLTKTKSFPNSYLIFCHILL